MQLPGPLTAQAQRRADLPVQRRPRLGQAIARHHHLAQPGGEALHQAPKGLRYGGRDRMGGRIGRGGDSGPNDRRRPWRTTLAL